VKTSVLAPSLGAWLVLCGALPAHADEVKAPEVKSPEAGGLKWLLANQLPNGGWGQGEESMEMGRGLQLKSTANVADTSIAVLALLRSGSSPKAGPHSAAAARGVEFILGEIEAADADSMAVTRVTGTRVQSKLGPYIDTFMAAALLPELEGKMPDGKAEGRLSKATAKVLLKMRKNQAQDGRFETGGWAPTLAQAMATRGINVAARNGIAVDEGMRQRAEKYAAQGATAAGGPAATEGSAGVGLYAAASTVSQMQQSAGTDTKLAAKAKDDLAHAKTPAEKKDAERRLDSYRSADEVQAHATDRLVGQINDPAFVSGFGSNGGEEFLSYMLIAESLRSKHAKDFQQWEAGMVRNLTRVQNGDGSWTGHHCITGRTFCTAAALLVLMADRAPVAHQEKAS
jgi:hypothetical protein